MVLLGAAVLPFPDTYAQDAATLSARQDELRAQFGNNPLRRPVILESSHSGGVLQGDAYAKMAYPHGTVSQVLQAPGRVCDILMLHVDVKSCRARRAGSENILSVGIGLQVESPESHRLDFTHRVLSSDPDYVAVLLNAETGPMGTKHYRIVLEAIPRDAKSTFLHLSYSYAHGMAARVATRAYLATAGRDKVGFTIVGRKPDGAPVYIGSERGMIERNTMLYYLAIEAYLAAPQPEQIEKRLNEWFTATERYPRQLREMERSEYLAMKRRDVAQHVAATQ